MYSVAQEKENRNIFYTRFLIFAPDVSDFLMFFPTAELASGVPQVLQSQRSPISDPISAEPICTGVGRRGAPRAVSVSVRPRSGKFLGFITLTIVFLIQNYRAFMRGRLAKIPVSSREFLIFGDRRR